MRTAQIGPDLRLAWWNKCENEIISMSRAWDKEKIWVPNRIRTYDLLEVTENMLKIALNLFYVWLQYCLLFIHFFLKTYLPILFFLGHSFDKSLRTTTKMTPSYVTYFSLSNYKNIKKADLKRVVYPITLPVDKDETQFKCTQPAEQN